MPIFKGVLYRKFYENFKKNNNLTIIEIYILVGKIFNCCKFFIYLYNLIDNITFAFLKLI